MTQIPAFTSTTLPPLESDRISFSITHNAKAASHKHLSVDGNIVHTCQFASANEPEDYEVYHAYLTELRALEPAEADLLKNLTNQQLNLVVYWLIEKTAEYQQREGPGAANPIFELSHDLTKALSLAKYDPTNTQTVETLHQLAESLVRRGAAKAARKLRTAGNAIPF